LNSKNKILIVGGTGFIGYHLAKKSLKMGWQVTSISKKPPKKIRSVTKVKYLYCDLKKKKFLKKIIKTNYDYVVNLGGYVDHSNTKRVIASHYLGCKNLTDIFIKKKIKSFVQMGSSLEYGNLKSPQKEIYNYNFNLIKSTYAKAKLLATLHLIKMFKEKNFPSTILRLYLAYGPKQDFNRLIPVVIKACKENKKFNCSNGNQLRDFVYINDVIDAIIKALKNKNAIGQIINVGSGKPIKVKKIIMYIKKVLKGGQPLFGKIKLRKDESIKNYANVKKAKKLINWIPKISFKEGLDSTIKYYNEQKF
tara:strand:+ start:62 stop:982 length:921 start_codon:yes stop_codon:yes gene_type:complete